MENKQLKVINQAVPNLIEELSPRLEKALVALGSITKIENDDDLQKANNILTKVRKTKEDFERKRKAITTNLDTLKQDLMKFEKAVDSNNSESLAYALKQKYKAYQTEKLRKQKEAQARIELEKQKELQKSEYKSIIRQAVADNQASLLTHANKYISDMMATMNLENADSLIKKLDYTPKLKEEKYKEFFRFEYDTSSRVISDSELAAVMAEVKKELPFDQVNDNYTQKAVEYLTQWKEKFQERKQMLVDAAKAEGEEKEKIEANIEKKAELDKAEMDQSVEQSQKEANQEIQQQQSNDKINAELESQAKKQGAITEKINSIRHYYFEDEASWHMIFAEVVTHCVMHEKFPDIRKMSGNTRVEVSGAKKYKDQIQWFLDFFSKNCDVEVNGLKYTEEAKVINRA